MGYSDQKYHTRPLQFLADSNDFTGTFTASNTAATLAAATYGIPYFTRSTKINGVRLVVKTAPTTGANTISFLNGTNTFATVASTSTVSAGQVLIGTLTNTASTLVTTQTITAANGSVSTNTVTSTTDWSVISSSTTTGITVAVAGTATASGNSFGAYEVFFEAREVFI